ncbi:MAG: single-stranded DNA-binding protein [Bacteroidales bacterium]|nr:single-stranded DNA-binding protein [Bacteroidales bacterium]
MTLNKVMLIGNVGKDPEPRHLESGAMLVTLTLATTERFKDRNGEVKEQTEWHNVVCWRSVAEIAEKYVRKGSQIYIEGRLRSRSWEDQNGQKRYVTEIVADTLRLLGRKSGQSPDGHNAPQVSSTKPVPTDPLEGIGAPLDDLPF